MGLPPDFDERWRRFEELYRRYAEEVSRRVSAGALLSYDDVKLVLRKVFDDVVGYIRSRLSRVIGEVCSDIDSFLERIRDTDTERVLYVATILWRIAIHGEVVPYISVRELEDFLYGFVEMVICGGS